MTRIFRNNIKSPQYLSFMSIMRSPNIKSAFNTKLSISEADILIDFLSNCKVDIVGGRLDIESKLKNFKRQFKVFKLKYCRCTIK